MQADSEHDRAWLEALNDEQRAAATAPDPTLLILAGAGTGKTTTLSARVAVAVDRGRERRADPAPDLHAPRGARDAPRAEALVERSRPRGGQAIGGTFHSVAYRMVRRHAASLGLGDNFDVLDAADVADLLDMLREEHGARRPRGASRARQRSPTSTRGRSTCSSRSTRCSPATSRGVADTARSWRRSSATTRAQAQLGVIDYDDLLLYWQAPMLDEVLAPHIAAGFDHVLVDEYQDVNALQVDIVAGAARARCRR